MTIDTCPLIGTPKQNAFACKIAAACKYERLADAINDGLGRPRGVPLPASIPVKPDAAAIIAFLLAKAEAMGVRVFGGKRKGRRRAPKAGAGSGSVARDNGETPDAADVLRNAPTTILAAELETRGVPAEITLADPDLVGGAAELRRLAARLCWQVEMLIADQGTRDLPFQLVEAAAQVREAIENTGADVATEAAK